MASASVTITVGAVNDAPVAVDDGPFATAEDTMLTVALPGILGNDTDVEGDALTAAVQGGPSNGALTLNADGSFTYDPTGSATLQALNDVPERLHVLEPLVHGGETDIGHFV